MRRMAEEVIPPRQEPCSWISSWLPSWRPTSPTQLKDAEEKMLKIVKKPFSRQYVRISGGNFLWTLAFSNQPCSPSLPSPKRPPLVLLHGFGGGVALWSQNLDTLCIYGPVYAIDLLGFGRSSRPQFCTDPALAEGQFVDALEEWRERVGIETMHLLGHNLGDTWQLLTPLNIHKKLSISCWWSHGAFQRVPKIPTPAPSLCGSEPWGPS
ncbi:hypothetical protein WMY93_019475 [Mugilogobius chulae]|uniref:1-acylglycerol-3-phosphate O-acyltransferase ABHD5 n=1 Tax=Mugilogobius chulae TaxID=88201 RepID=A0AAW0NQC0_9GOBI